MHPLKSATAITYFALSSRIVGIVANVAAVIIPGLLFFELLVALFKLLFCNENNEIPFDKIRIDSHCELRSRLCPINVSCTNFQI